MKRKLLIVLSLILSIGLLFLFPCCKKSEDASPADNGYEVSYKMITDDSSQTISIKYNNETGSLVEGYDANTPLPTWTKSIRLSQKPFLARMTTSISNTSNQSVHFTLAISVNGELRKVQSGIADPQATSDEEVGYLVE